MKHLIRTLIGMLVIALASYLTTHRMSSIAIPTGVVELSVVDDNGIPVRNAEVEILRNGIKSYKNPYYHYETTMVTDEKGVLQLAQPMGGTLTGGKYWNLFWFYQITEREPDKFEVLISIPGKASRRVSIHELYEKKTARRIEYMFYKLKKELSVYTYKVIVSTRL